MISKLVASRHGLVRCPSCGVHTRLAQTPNAAACPACGNRLSLKRRHFVSGRGGLIAASLLAASVVGCGTSESEAPEPPSQTEPTIPEAPEPDLEAETDPDPRAETPEPLPAPDPPAASAYGAPPVSDQEPLDDL